MKKYLPIILIASLLLTLGVLYVFSSYVGKVKLTNSNTQVNRNTQFEEDNPQITTTPSSQKTNENQDQYKVIYRDPNDTEDRTVIYAELKSGKLFGGSGLIKNKYNDLPYFMVGLFKGWQAIDGSKDRYIKLFDPINKKDLPLIRVAFEPSPLFDGEDNMTNLSIENITSAQNLAKNTVDNTKSYFYKYEKKLDKFLQNNDAVTVFFTTNSDLVPNKDINDHYGAQSILLRRKNGLADFLKEIK